MVFKNEYTPNAGCEKHDLLKICREHNQTFSRDSFIHPDSWTIDREREVFLVKIWVHRESEFSGYAGIAKKVGAIVAVYNPTH